MSFITFFRILWAKRAIILLATLGSFLAAVFVAAMVPPRYEATSKFLLDLLKADPVSGEMIGARSGREYVKTQIQLINDYRVAGKVVDALGWTSSPAMAARYAQRPPNDNRDFRRWLAQGVIDNTYAAWVENSGVVSITYSASSPETAAKMADAVRQAYLEYTLDTKRESAARTGAWFEQQTDKLRKQIAIAEKRKADFERENNVILAQDNTDPEMVKLQALAQSVPAAQAATAAFIAPATAQLAQIEAQIAMASRTLGPNHPDLQVLRQQRTVVESAIARETAASRSSGPGGGPSVQSMLSAQTTKVLAQRGKVAEAQRLATEVAVLKNQFDKAAGRAADLQQQAQTTESGITLMGSAVTPTKASFPNIPLIIVGATTLGFAFGVLTSLVIELLSRRVRGPEDLANSGVPVIGAMGPSGSDRDGGVLWRWLGIRRPVFRRAPA